MTKAGKGRGSTNLLRTRYLNPTRTGTRDAKLFWN